MCSSAELFSITQNYFPSTELMLHRAELLFHPQHSFFIAQNHFVAPEISDESQLIVMNLHEIDEKRKVKDKKRKVREKSRQKNEKSRKSPARRNFRGLILR
jgi:hypothetical protein